MKKKTGRRSIYRRSLYGHRRNIDHRLRNLRQDVDMLDRVIAQTFPEALSEHEDAWARGCREGFAIAYDLMVGAVEDIAIRGKFKPYPIKMRYYPEAERTTKDDALINTRRRLGD